ncbi:MAG TPA: enoyl-CoA hydratase-related protein [Mycobacteriales bacterium]|nr:enoyl-CoA hydratase-related protein [Mycobacteriales bacterium]
MGATLTVTNSVAIITIGPPTTRNALTGDAARELLACLDEVDAHQDVGALVVRGADGQFCSGADRGLLAAARERPNDPEVIGALAAIYESFQRLATLRVPTIAAIRGAAVGAGLNLALAADVRVVARDARIISGFLRIGLHPGGGHFRLLERAGGAQATVAMTLLGEEIDGRRMVELGLAWETLEDEAVESRALELAARASAPELIRDAVATFRAQSEIGRMPMWAAIRAEQAGQWLSFVRAPG